MEANELTVKSEKEAVPALHILGAEDDASLRTLEGLFFSRLGVAFELVENGGQGLELLRQDLDRFNAVVSDRDMPGIKGEEFLSEVKKMKPDIITALITGRQYDESEIEELRKAGVDHYVYKPYSLDTIGILVGKMKETLAAQHSNE